MSRISRRSRNRTWDKRIGHKKARQATRRVLENEHVEGRVQSMHYSTRVEQPPVPDTPVGPPKPKKGGCKRNKYGPHVIEAWPREPMMRRRWDDERGEFVYEPTPYWLRPYHAPYRCANCGKGFYSIPKRNAVMKQSSGSGLRFPDRETSDHYDTYNIKMRLLGLDCRCDDCNSVIS